MGVTYLKVCGIPKKKSPEAASYNYAIAACQNMIQLPWKWELGANNIIKVGFH